MEIQLKGNIGGNEGAGRGSFFNAHRKEDNRNDYLKICIKITLRGEISQDKGLFQAYTFLVGIWPFCLQEL